MKNELICLASLKKSILFLKWLESSGHCQCNVMHSNLASPRRNWEQVVEQVFLCWSLVLDDILDVAGISVSAHKERRKRGTSGKMHLRASPQRRDRIFIVRVEKMLVKSVEGGTLLVILTILLINDHGNISTYKISPYVKTKEMLPNLPFKYFHIQYIFDQNSEIDTNDN